MKRIIRLPDSDIPRMLDRHVHLQRILRRHLPPGTASLYATPKAVDGGTVDWYSSLDGQPVPFTRLGAEEAADVRRVLDAHLASIRHAAEHLPAGSDSAQARQLLREAAQPPADAHVHVLNGQPVITAWGGGGQPRQPMTSASAQAPPSTPSAAPRQYGWWQRRRRGWWWLWLLLLLLLLALLLWWWCLRPSPLAAVPLAEACPPESASAAAPEPAAEPAPELVIVFDASGSMDASVNSWLWHLLHFSREPRRITTAREAAHSVVQRLPDDVSAGLVLLESCPAARPVGFFPPAQRGQLLELLDAVTPQGGTALADGIAKAGVLLDGVHRESVLLVVSDGGESCGGSACAAARRLAREKPRLKINVVDIGGTGAGNCLAQATGGEVFTANTVQDVQNMTARAARDVLAPAHCRR